MNEEPNVVDDLAVVFRAPNEHIANIVRSLLVSEDIPVVLKSRQIPWMDGVMSAGEGYWGDVLVPHADAQRSKELIEAYQADIPDEDVQGGEDEPTV